MAENTLKTAILDALGTVIDPELRIDIVNLGLIYNIAYDGETEVVTVDMTLTTMGCPLVAVLEDMIKTALRGVDGVSDAVVNLVWEPAWTMDKMSRYAKLSLGLV